MAEQEAIIDISVVSPVYGCRNCLEALVERIEQSLQDVTGSFEIVLVDDASPDHAWQLIVELASNRPWVRGIRLSRNFGQHAAISAGLAASRGNRVVVMDCDLQDRPEEIPRLIAGLSDDVHVVLAQRAVRMDSPLKKLGSRLFYGFLGWLTGTRYDHTTANFGVYSRSAVDAFNAMPESERFFPLLMRWTGFRMEKLEVQHDARGEGETGYSLRKLLRLAFHIALSFSDKPLRVVVIMSIACAIIAIVLALLAITRYWAGDIQVAGFTSIVASIWLVGSATLGSIGVVGLYVGRIFTGVKLRPNYIVANTVGG